MPVRFLSDAELARLSGWPDDVSEDDLVTFFTLTSDDLGWLGSNVRMENRLGAAVQLCTLPWLGWIPDDLNSCPSAAVDRLANLLGLAGGDVPRLLAAYGGWEGRTRRDHRALVCSCSSHATGYAANGSSVHRWTRCLDELQRLATERGPRPTIGWHHCWRRLARLPWTGCSTSTTSWA
jgi:hypothetical protein